MNDRIALIRAALRLYHGGHRDHPSTAAVIDRMMRDIHTDDYQAMTGGQIIAETAIALGVIEKHGPQGLAHVRDLCAELHVPVPAWAHDALTATIDGDDLVCPYCHVKGEVCEEDQAVRHNTIQVQDGVIFASTGDATFLTVRFYCAACDATVTLPSEIEDRS